MAQINKTRKVAALLENGHATVLHQPVPEVGEGELLVRVHASLLSPGTELSQARQSRREKVGSEKVVRTFGYQNAGVVEAIGPGVERFKAGDRVACMGPGALHTDNAVVPQNLAVPLPENVSFEEGAYCHLAATALMAVRRGKVSLGENLLVVGAGLIGHLSAQLGELSGSRVMLWDTLPARLEIAQKSGRVRTVCIGAAEPIVAAEQFTRGRGFDVAIVAIGGEGSGVLRQVHDVMQVTPDGHREGRVVMVGGLVTTTQWAAGLGNLDVLSSARTGPGYHDEQWERGKREYPYPWVRWSTRDNLELVIQLIAEGKLQVKPLTTHRLKLEEVDRAVSAHIEEPNGVLGTILLME